MNPSAASSERTAYEWWVSRRLRFNLILLAAVPVSLACLLVVGVIFESRVPCLEITLFTIAFGAILFALGLLVANVCYLLGPLVEWLVLPRRATVLRKRLFVAGAAFSVMLIFSPVFANLAAAMGSTQNTSCRDGGI